MTEKTKPSLGEIVPAKLARPRPLGLRLRITDRDLVKKIQIAMELTQTWRQDLDISFSRAR
jgi:hypothetical protein